MHCNMIYKIKPADRQIIKMLKKVTILIKPISNADTLIHLEPQPETQFIAPISKPKTIITTPTSIYLGSYQELQR